MIRSVEINDAEAIVKIYNYYITNTVVTFETKAVKCDEMKNRIKDKIEKNPWIVYEEEGEILGYAYVGEINPKEAYSKTREVTIYVDKNSIGKGIGSKLMKELIKRCKEFKFHLLVSLITVPNEKSMILHERFGFERAGLLKEAGFKMNKWLDVSYWQLKI